MWLRSGVAVAVALAAAPTRPLAGGLHMPQVQLLKKKKKSVRERPNHKSKVGGKMTHECLIIPCPPPGHLEEILLHLSLA